MRDDNTASASEFYRQGLTIRRFEETILALFDEGVLNGTVHTCIGQEACSVGVVSALNKDIDSLVSNHRGHGHFLSYCDQAEELMAELLGREDGVVGGVGGTQHLHYRNFYSNGIQGGVAPVATGAALTAKQTGSGAISVAFLGDGTMGEGVVYETFNLASLWKLPVLFVVTNNRYAQTTPVENGHAGDITQRSVPFDIPVTVVEADTVWSVFEAATKVVDEIRAGGGPQLLHLKTYRFSPHSKGDDFRSEDELAAERAKDPLRLLGESLPEGEQGNIEAAVNARIEKTVEMAKAGKPQIFSEFQARMLKEGIFAS